MNNWFTVKAKYTKQLENGTFKRVTEPYLLAAMTFGDAENSIYQQLSEIVKGEFSVTAITKTELHDIFSVDTSDVWYVCKIKFKSDSDESRGKVVIQTFLVGAISVKDANDRLKEELSTLMVDYEITSVAVSPIVEIFPFEEVLDEEI